MKTFRKFLFYVLLTAVVLIIALATSAFLFKDQIINRFIQQANQRLNTPVKIGEIDVSVFHYFPQLSIVFKNVYIEDSHSGQYPLLTASQISFQLNPLEAYRGIYNVLGLQISDSETNLKINSKGENNYTILREDEVKSSGSISFELKNVELVNCKVRYLDLQRKEDLQFYSPDLEAFIATSDDIYTIAARGELTTEKIQVGTTSLLQNKLFHVKTDLVYLDLERKLLIQPSEIRLNTSVFTVQGDYQWKEKNNINLTGSGKDTDIQTLLALLPGKTTQRLSKYESEGEVYFNLEMQGEISKTRSPALSIDFGFNQVTLTHPEYKTKIEKASLEGSFATGGLNDLALSALSLKNIKGQLNEKYFRANLVIQDFTDPSVVFDFEGELDAASLLDFYPVEVLNQVSGTVLADVSFEGKISWLKTRESARQASTLGSIELRSLNLEYGKDKVPVKDLSGTLQFNNNDLALSNISGKLGNSDFLLNGFFKNAVTFLLFEDQPIGIESDLKSDFLDVDQLFAVGFAKDLVESKVQEYEFKISRNLNLKFDCDVKALQYKRLRARNLKGDLLITNEKAVSRNITLNAMGGDLMFTGIVDAKNPKAIQVSSAFRLNGLNVDSVFYVFENFQQDFIQDKHLKGKALADVTLEFVLNPNLRMFSETLLADISLVIQNGQLNHFEPLYQLNKYLDDEGLKALRFADLKNDIHIKDKVIYIPQMEVRSNVTVLQISGKHAFDQQIDYRIITPLNNKKKVDITEAAGAIEDMEGRSKLFLKVTGTTEDYEVQYDTDAVRKKIASDFKKEVQELKDVFRNKKKKKGVELSEEEFDWDHQ